MEQKNNTGIESGAGADFSKDGYYIIKSARGGKFTVSEKAHNGEPLKHSQTLSSHENAEKNIRASMRVNHSPFAYVLDLTAPAEQFLKYTPLPEDQK